MLMHCGRLYLAGGSRDQAVTLQVAQKLVAECRLLPYKDLLLIVEAICLKGLAIPEMINFRTEIVDVSPQNPPQSSSVCSLRCRAGWQGVDDVESTALKTPRCCFPPSIEVYLQTSY